MARLPLNTLPAFVEVARRGNLRAAADVLHLTHSAVSQQIQHLEAQTGLQLFDRPGRRIVLNAAGEALLRGVAPALAQLDSALRDAAATSANAATVLRLTTLPSFAQRWLLPRMGRWRARHPGVVLDLHTSQNIEDLAHGSHHAALRQGSGPWRGLVAWALLDSPRIVVGSPAVAQRLAGRGAQALADEPLLGNTGQWRDWFALQGLAPRITPVAAFNDAGLMLQATEQGLGISLSRQLLAADALADGRLVQLSPVTVAEEGPDRFWLATTPARADWPPLLALRDWLQDELAQSAAALAAIPALSPAGTAAAGPTGSRSRARSATPARNPAR
ncbi:LysR substrate-binding domain-containing protein [Pseudaquabacterium pictum]|uniref:LysR family transcriptional regulator n=1 Tax=Pseudaquabacterium pictum TaxID=2315236 RepID=A0A480AVH9_9BURK|nr:LysR substrate-binding domain-containing protein [Rubrivivax pictus]GCL64920.1 LysR family transcriptional regulator [Rubrivivax pictus]